MRIFVSYNNRDRDIAARLREALLRQRPELDLYFAPIRNTAGDSYQPQQIAQRVASMGVAKARADGLTLLVLAVLAGAFISLGALLFTVIVTDSWLGFGVTRLLGGLGFCLGLVLVVIGGAELFTGNNLLAIALPISAFVTLGFEHSIANWFFLPLGLALGGPDSPPPEEPP